MRHALDLTDASEQHMARFIDELKVDSRHAQRIDAHPGLLTALRHGFEAHSLLGEGGLSEVWSGIDENTGRVVAIKVHRGDRLERSINPLQREAIALARVRHPGVVGLIRQGGEGRSGYLVLEFVEGLPLDQFARNKSMDGRRLLRLCEAVCRLVGEVHAAQLVHGDLKPSNILVRADGSPVLIDFGLSVRPDGEGSALRESVVHGGTDRFMAPELRDGHRTMPGYPADIYALGQTVRQLFEDASLAVSPALEAVLSRATAHAPHERHPTVLDLADGLGKLAGPMAQSRRRRAGLGLTVAFAALATLGGAFGLAMDRGGDHTGEQNARPATPQSLAEVAELARAGHVAAAREALVRMDQDKRPWEWRHLWAATGGQAASEHVAFAKPGMSSILDPTGSYALVGTSGGLLYQTSIHGESRELFQGPTSISHLSTLRDGGFLVTDLAGHVYRAGEGGVTTLAKLDARPTVCWDSGGAGVVQVWDTLKHEVLSLGIEAGEVQVLGRYDAVLVAASAPGWVWTITAPPGSDEDANRIYDNRFMGPGWVQHRHDTLAQGDLAMCVDHDPESSATVVGTLHGQLRLYEAPGGAAQTWDLGGDEAILAVLLSPTERRVFAATDAELLVFDLDAQAVTLRLPQAGRGLPRQVHLNAQTGLLTLLTDYSMMQWHAPHPHESLASR